MLLTELLFQRVKELGATGNYALKPGCVALVSRASTLRALILACLFPAPDDASVLVDPAARAGPSPGPTRVGLGLLARDGTPYRLLRELGAARALHKYDPQQKRFASLTQDDLRDRLLPARRDRALRSRRLRPLLPAAPRRAAQPRRAGRAAEQEPGERRSPAGAAAQVRAGADPQVRRGAGQAVQGAAAAAGAERDRRQAGGGRARLQRTRRAAEPLALLAHPVSAS